MTKYIFRAPPIGGALLFLTCPSIRLSVRTSVFLSRHPFLTNDNEDGWQNGRCLSVCIYRGHSNLVILIGFLPNFIYGLLPSNPDSSLDMSFVRQTITKMANKMAASYQFVSARCCGHSNLVILFQVLLFFIYGLLVSNSGSSLNMSFVQKTIAKMVDKMAAAYQFASICCCGHSNFFIPISSNFHVWIAAIKLWFKLKYKFCPTNDSQDGRQNGCRLPVCTGVHPTLVIYYLIASKFHIRITFIKLSPRLIWAFSATQNGLQNGHNLSVYTCGHSNLVIYHLISSKFHTYSGPTSNMFFFR